MTFVAALTLLRPVWLAVLGLVPLFAWLAFRAARGRPRAGDWAALAARTLLLATLALALSVPRVETKSKGRSVAYVLDVSESMPPTALRRAQEFIRDSAPLRGEDDDAAFLVFADRATVETPFARMSATRGAEASVVDPTNISSRLPRGESAIDEGLILARAGFPPGGARRIVLLTDGNETRGDAEKVVRGLLAEKVDVQVVPIRYERPDEVLVEKLVAPATAGTVAPAAVRMVVQNTARQETVRAKVRFLVDDVEVVSRVETLKQGANVFEMSHRFESSGFHRVEAVVEPEVDGDPANNRGRAAVVVLGRGRVLLASAAANSPLAEALRANLDGDVDAGGADVLPADPGGLVPYDAVVLENISAYSLTDVQRRILASAVRDLGVGLVCIGGPLTYGPGGYAGTELEAVLPVSSEIQNKRVLPSGALVVVLHTCEFAAGNAMGRTCAKLAARALSSSDEFGLLEYGRTQKDSWVVELARVGDKDALCARIDAAEPSDMPSLETIVGMAYEGLTKSNAAVKHMVVISDGDPVMPDAKLQQKIRDDKITISTVCIDPHGGRGGAAPMEQLAKQNGGNFYPLQSSQSDRLPQIFVKEAVTIRRSAVNEEPFQPTMRALHRMLRDFEEKDLPTLRGRVVTSEKPKAEILLAASEEDPLLASWRCGLGQSVAWTSDASAWAQDWVKWGGYGRFFAQVVKSSLRALNRAGARASTDLAGGAAHVKLDVLRPDGSFDNGLEVKGAAVLPDGTSETFHVEQTGPGRYEGRFPAKQVGTYIATLTYRDPASPDAPEAQVMAAVCVAYSAEHLAQRSNERFFALLESAGATLVDVDRYDDALAKDPDAPNARRIPWEGAAADSTETLELWPWIAAAAALLLVADVAVRRVRIPWDKVFKRRAPRAPGTAPVIARGVAKPSSVGAFDPSPAPRGVTPTAVAPPSAPSPGPAPSAPPTGAGGGLLGAKKRARKRENWEENQ
jgi:uncharacterized membrane protein